tara:strand:- start:2716 stop:2904 length:189 start_codon:yes stop_codon:yes gene_type:complete
MIKIITWINFGLFIAGITSLGYGYLNREKIIEGMINKALPDLVEKALPPVPSIPPITGGVKL